MDTQKPTRSSPNMISIIEPDDDTAKLYESFFSKRGYAVQRTAWLEGVDAKAAVIVGEPSDVDTGLFVRSFRQNSSKPLIVASARPDVLSGTRFDKNTWAITKPFSMIELEECVDCILGAPVEQMVHKS